MEIISLSINYKEYTSENELDAADRQLLKEAWTAADKAYAPYSRFKVGAAVKLVNEQIVTGNNQENAAYPSGLCAERTAVFAASSQFPGIPMETIAIVAHTDVFELEDTVTPCGACRQVLAEYENLSKKPLRVLLQSHSNRIYLIEGMHNLLPLTFKADGLKK